MVYFEFWLGIVTGLLGSALYYFIQSHFGVLEGHLGVVTCFGKAEFSDPERKLLKTYGPGLHWVWPWKKVQIVSVMERNLDLSGEKGGISAMAEDGTVFRLDSKLRYIPIEKELYTYLFVTKNTTDHLRGLVECLLRNEIANFGAHLEGGLAVKLEDAMGGPYFFVRRERRLLNRYISEFCQSQISGRHDGYRFSGIDLIDILPPDELTDSLNAVIRAHAEAEALFAQTESDCVRRVLAAEAGMEIATARAKAVETEIIVLGEYLAALQKSKTLQSYVMRRRTEVFAESRTVFRRDF